MNNLEIVPWMCKEEWEFCRNSLFGDDLFMKRKALEHLYVWKIRCPYLPIAVECTLILMEVYLKGKNKDDNQDTLSNTMNYESWYSVAIMRFLNLIMDSEVGTKSSSTINQLAKEIDIPEWIVEIRHSVAHGPTLPNLTVLEDAVERCLQWLYNSYWKDNVYENVSTEENKNDGSSTFQCFEACLFVKKLILTGTQDFTSIPAAHSHKIEKLFVKPDQKPNISLESQSIEAVYNSILKKFSRHLKKDTKYGKDLVTSLLRNDEYLLSKQVVQNDSIEKEFLSEWCEILTVICSSNVCSYFLEELARIVTSPLEESRRQYSAAVILNEILKNIYVWKELNSLIQNVENSVQSRKKMKKKLNVDRNKGNLTIPLTDVKLTDEDVLRILDLILHNPNELVKMFLKSLVALLDPNNYSVKYSKLLTLIDIYLGKSSTDAYTDFNFDCVQTLRKLMGTSEPDEIDMNENLDENENDSNDYPMLADNKGEWDWSKTPLGILPWQSDCRLWVHIYDDE